MTRVLWVDAPVDNHEYFHKYKILQLNKGTSQFHKFLKSFVVKMIYQSDW